MTKSITVAYGDGIGPEIMESTLEILREAKADIKINVIEVGKKIYEKGFTSGLMPSAWDEINSSRVLLKAPITTPQGGGYKSLNVTMRKKLGLFANLRPVASFHPFVTTNFPKMDVVIVRENEEDLYAGIEYRQTDQTYECLKIVTRDGCEKIVRFAFEYAINNNRKKVTCFSKDNIMKMTDGIFHKTFDEIAKEYPQIATDHYIVDIGAARLAAKPEIFDVIVTSNLFGDIISDITAEISGSVGLAGSANVGQNYAMFEAIHGSAPDIAGKNIANPSGLLNGAIMMLIHIGQGDIASVIENAWKKTLEDGIHTGDIYNEKIYMYEYIYILYMYEYIYIHE
jgi:isocitrate dehydrogenase